VEEIRTALFADAGSIAALTTQLGYPATEEEISRRLRRILDDPDQLILVSCDPAGRPVGWIHVGQRALLEADRQFEILGLIVDAAHRRGGRAQRLVMAGEAWAATRGATELAVRSNVVRAESHPFYERAGYIRVKTQHVYRKPLV
jgi:GNAT superfamily N-acetyltransferase